MEVHSTKSDVQLDGLVDGSMVSTDQWVISNGVNDQNPYDIPLKSWFFNGDPDFTVYEKITRNHFLTYWLITN